MRRHERVVIGALFSLLVVCGVLTFEPGIWLGLSDSAQTVTGVTWLLLSPVVTVYSVTLLCLVWKRQCAFSSDAVTLLIAAFAGLMGVVLFIWLYFQRLKMFE
jgi:hypothetical protein